MLLVNSSLFLFFFSFVVVWCLGRGKCGGKFESVWIERKVRGKRESNVVMGFGIWREGESTTTSSRKSVAHITTINFCLQPYESLNVHS